MATDALDRFAYNVLPLTPDNVMDDRVGVFRLDAMIHHQGINEIFFRALLVDMRAMTEDQRDRVMLFRLLLQQNMENLANECVFVPGEPDWAEHLRRVEGRLGRTMSPDEQERHWQRIPVTCEELLQIDGINPVKTTTTYRLAKRASYSD